MQLSIENANLDLIIKVCTKAKSNNFTTISEYLIFLVEQDLNANRKLSEEYIYSIIENLINLAIQNRKDFLEFTMQELYTYCIKNEEKFNYPKWSNLNRSVRIILGKKFKSEILKHSKKFEKGEFYLKFSGLNINNSALYTIERVNTISANPLVSL